MSSGSGTSSFSTSSSVPATVPLSMVSRWWRQRQTHIGKCRRRTFLVTLAWRWYTCVAEDNSKLAPGNVQERPSVVTQTWCQGGEDNGKLTSENVDEGPSWWRLREDGHLCWWRQQQMNTGKCWEKTFLVTFPDHPRVKVLLKITVN